MNILITSPSLDSGRNISGISSVVKFIIETNPAQHYIPFELGRKDNEKRNPAWVFRMLRQYFKWIRIMASRKNIAVHFNTPLCNLSALRDLPLIMLARLFRKRMIIHLHGGDYLMQKTPPAWMLLLWKMSFTGRNPLIVMSSDEERILQERIGKKRIYTLPNCINLDDAARYERIYTNDPVLRLLFLGRISIDKGIEFIYRALKNLKLRNAKFTFVMAGRGPDEEVYKRKFSDLLGNDFEFTGVVTGSSKTAVFKKCDVFVLPSFYEGLPMALLESMSFGLVPVITNVGSISNVVTDGINGLFVRTRSASDIEYALDKLGNDIKLRNELSRNAKQSIFRNFNPVSYVEKLNEIYNYE